MFTLDEHAPEKHRSISLSIITPQLPVQNGLGNVLIFDRRTPTYVLKLVILENNRYHVGNKFNTTQMYEYTVSIAAARRAHKNENRINSTACPQSGPFSYPGLYAQLINNNCPTMYNGFARSNSAKTGLAEMQRMSV